MFISYVIFLRLYSLHIEGEYIVTKVPAVPFHLEISACVMVTSAEASLIEKACVCSAVVSWKPPGHQMASVISYDDRGDMVVSSASQVASQVFSS